MALFTFPTLKGLMFPVSRQPVWAGARHRSISGKRTALSWYSFPYYSYELTFSFLRQQDAYREYQELLALYNSVNAGTLAWLYNDPEDNTATAAQFGTGDGSTVAFQLLRPITGTSRTWSDPVYAPTAGFSVFDNGVLVPGANYTVGSTGIITFNVAPVAGHPITWTGTFKWVCRFDEDTQELSQFARNFWELKSCKFSTEKL